VPHLTIGIDPLHGPIITLLVGVSTPRAKALADAGLPRPNPIGVNFLVDTGAACTVIDESLIAPLGLVPTGQAFVETPTTGKTPQPRFLYDVGMMILHSDHNRMFHNLPVIATDLSAQKIGGLLGRDVLALCLLVYDGPARHFSLAF
jgi:Aspartyl protease